MLGTKTIYVKQGHSHSNDDSPYVETYLSTFTIPHYKLIEICRMLQKEESEGKLSYIRYQVNINCMSNTAQDSVKSYQKHSSAQGLWMWVLIKIEGCLVYLEKASALYTHGSLTAVLNIWKCKLLNQRLFYVTYRRRQTARNKNGLQDVNEEPICSCGWCKREGANDKAEIPRRNLRGEKEIGSSSPADGLLSCFSRLWGVREEPYHQLERGNYEERTGGIKYYCSLLFLHYVFLQTRRMHK